MISIKHYTKIFDGSEDRKHNKLESCFKIDKWLESFRQDRPALEYNFEVIGYVAVDNMIVITVKVFDCDFRM